MRRPKRIIVILAALLALFFGYSYLTNGDGSSPSGDEKSERAQTPPGGGGGRPGGGNRAVFVVVEPVQIKPFNEIFQAIGTVSSKSRAQVIAESSGFVTATDLDANQFVHKGDVLATLESHTAELALETANTRLSQAQATVSRYQSLKNTVAKAQLEQAQTDLELARVDVENAKYELSRRTILAPISGPLGLSDIEVGSYLNAGTKIVTISNPDKLLVKFSLSDRAQDFVKVGTPIEIRLPTRVGNVFHAEISGLDAEIDPTTRQIAMQANLNDPEAIILPGSVVDILVSQLSEPMPNVPALAVSWSREGASVWVSKEGKAVSVPIEIAYRSGDDIWVRGDLAEGDLVVVEGTQKVRAGGELQFDEIMGEAAAPSDLEKAGNANGQ